MSTSFTALLLTIGSAYLTGAIPFGLLLARLKGVDIRTVGSGNIGATNVFRSVGRSWGILTLLLDLLKGLCGVVLLPPLALWLLGGGTASAELQLCGGVAAVVGHTWPIYAGFRGGKGVATSAGMLLGLAPWAVLLALLLWLVTLALSRYVSLASIVAAVVMGVAVWFVPFRPAGSLLVPAALSLLALLVVVRHRSNIMRLLSGTEARFSRRGKRG